MYERCFKWEVSCEWELSGLTPVFISAISSVLVLLEIHTVNILYVGEHILGPFDRFKMYEIGLNK